MIAGFNFLPVGTVFGQQSVQAELSQQVRNIEQAFAASMANRDFDAFTAFLSDETVFFSGDAPLRGKEQVAGAWKAYFEGPDAPFSWEPREVEVLDSGTLALSSGPVYDPDGKQVAIFTSIWRLEAPGEWRIVFDKGNPACDVSAATSPESSGS